MLEGNKNGLKPNQLKKLEKLADKRIDKNELITSHLARSISEFSASTSRQLGLIIDRQGIINYIIIGDSKQIVIPYLGRFKQEPGRLRGLRLVHTHLDGKPIDEDDLSDLALLRLDSVSVVNFEDNGATIDIETKHLLPANSPDRFADYHYDLHGKNDSYIQFIEALDDEIYKNAKSIRASDSKYAAIIVGLYQDRSNMEYSTQEIKELAKGLDIEILDSFAQIRKPDPKFLTGKGKLKEVVVAALHLGADFLIYDNQLSPAQLNNISRFTELKIIDRTQLIMDIFASRATTSEGRIRVELAQLQYRLPQLVGKGDSLSRLAGGIGGRGPGETKLEIDRRRISTRISRLKEKLKEIEKNRLTNRKSRNRANIPIVSILGYTNAGKSTLLNQLTSSNTYADNKMFATLSTVTKRVRFPIDRDAVFVDTVGFIQDLPSNLMGAFKSTIEEAGEADLFIHLLDGSDPHYIKKYQIVIDTLRDLNLEEKYRITVVNKSDILDDHTLEEIKHQLENPIFISALDRSTTLPMLEKIETMLFEQKI